ncbi:MAG: hypothetical protein JXP72_06425 [Coriobacteriia bacterium]|nr:hypothetical protein [Coriobacteriia bacterium]
MKRSTHIRRFIIALAMALVVHLLMGCEWLDFFGNAGAERIEAEKIREEMGQQLAESQKLEEFKQVESDQALPSGHVLSVRVNWGVDTDATVCTVRIENPRNNWYDYIEDTTTSDSLGSGGRAFGDYPFTAENFNRQMDTQYYPEPDDIAGVCELTVNLNNGASERVQIFWDGAAGAFSPNLLNIPL